MRFRNLITVFCFDKYKANKLVFLKEGTDGLASNTDIATTNIYNYIVEPIKTIDIKTEDDREKDREYYINSQE